MALQQDLEPALASINQIIENSEKLLNSEAMSRPFTDSSISHFISRTRTDLKKTAEYFSQVLQNSAISLQENLKSQEQSLYRLHHQIDAIKEVIRVAVKSRSLDTRLCPKRKCMGSITSYNTFILSGYERLY